MKIGTLFTGIGGFDLAAEWMGWRTIWQSEIDPYCTALLRERFPGVPNLGDITTIDWSTVERPDIITGGFPCQDISYAGKGAGLAGARSGLWYEYARAIRELGPRYIVVENVRALLTRGFDAVLGTLADLGYDAEWAMYGASDVGAPHRRNRVWILAYAQSVAERKQTDQADPFTVGRETRDEPRESCSDDADPDGQRFAVGEEFDRATQAGRQAVCDRRHPGRLRDEIPDAERKRLEGIKQARPAARPADRSGDERHPCWWAVEPDVGRVAHGIPARVDRLRGLGNAIVPECALPIYRRIEEIEREPRGG